MSKFEDDLMQRIQSKILNDVAKHDWLAFPAYRDKIKIGNEILIKAYEQIDKDKIISLLADKINQRIADKIADAMQTELANDVKQLVSNDVVRGKLRKALADKALEFINAIPKA